MKRKTLLLLVIVLSLTAPLLGPRSARAQDAASDLLGRINALRSSLGVHPYALNAALSAAAQNHAQWMASTGQVSHTQPDGSTPSTRAAAAGYGSTWVSENIYMGTNATAATAWGWWMNSPIHYRGITSANYSEVGIGAASGPSGTAYVLVFGNPGGWQAAPQVASAAVRAGASSGQPRQPAYVVGVDNHGNIMHEIQPGHTLGDIALFYGYTWADIPGMLELNNMTTDDIRELEIGAIFLVPPHSGTYTPTPDPQAAATAAPDEAQVSALTVEETPAPAITPSLTPTPTATVPGIVVTSAVVPEWVVQTAVAASAAEQVEFTPETPPTDTSPQTTPPWTAATVTPTPGVIVAFSGGEPPQNVPSVLEPVTAEIIVQEKSDTPFLLYVAVALQVVILVGAWVEYWRRRRG